MKAMHFMNSKKKGQSTSEYMLLVAIAIFAFLACTMLSQGSFLDTALENHFDTVKTRIKVY